ncbi:MAG: hypothetical protein ACLFV7_11570 [Phycisphaerae bacterium]
MSIDLQYNDNLGILYATCYPPMALEEFEDALKRIVDSDEHPPDVPTLWDTRQVRWKNAHRGSLKQMIAIREGFPCRGKARLAILVAGDLGFGMSRMYEAFSHDLPQSIRVFRDQGKAEDWLLER